MADSRAVEERRFGAIQALRAVVECLRESNPQNIFQVNKDATLETAKVQAIATRWADKASDVLLKSLDLADRVAGDALLLFEEDDASGPRPPAHD